MQASPRIQPVTMRVVMFGPSGAGKSCFVVKLEALRNVARSGLAFDAQGLPIVETTIGVDFVRLAYVNAGTEYLVQLWDTAGQERFRSIARTYLRGALCVLLMLDVMAIAERRRPPPPGFAPRRAPLGASGNPAAVLDNYMEDLTADKCYRSGRPPYRELENGPLVYVVVSKGDLLDALGPDSEEQRVVAELRAVCAERGLRFAVVSAKTGAGVVELFNEMAGAIAAMHRSYVSNEELLTRRAVDLSRDAGQRPPPAAGGWCDC